MRLDSSISPNKNVRTEAPVRVPQDTGGKNDVVLSEGDVVQAKVIARRGEVVSLKTADGTVFRARLEAGVQLPTGGDALFVVKGEEAGVIYMALAEPGQAGLPLQPVQVPAADAAVLRALAALGFTASPKMVQGAQELLATHPELSVDEAVFLAANKLPAEPSLLRAVSALFAGRGDTAAMLEGLSQLAALAADAPVMERLMAQQTNVPGHGAVTKEFAILTALGQPGTPEQAAAAVAEQSSVPAGAEHGKVIPATLTEQAANAAALPTTQTAPTVQMAVKPPVFAEWLANALQSGAASVQEALAQSPAFAGLPARSLAAVAESLGRIADSMPTISGERELFESIVKFAGELFLRPEDGTEGTAQKLKTVREELYVKLAFFRDAVASSETPQKGLILEQTQRLMDHVRLLANLEQFVCIQLPVQNGQSRGNAELYIYKREKNGSHRLDPEDVKILLALELMHMGHLEALIEVKGKEVSLRFEVETEEAATVFKDHTTKLHKMLDISGYKFTNSQVSSRKRGTTIESALLTLLSHEEKTKAGLDYTV